MDQGDWAETLSSNPAREPAVSDYDALHDVLNAAAAQATEGKGAQRHANGKPWLEQTLFRVTAVHGIGFPTGQAAKKIEEAMGMIARNEHDAARRELLGAIVYLAAACHVLGDVRRAPDERG